MLIHDFSLRISSEFALVYSVMEPLLLRHCTTSLEEVLASEIGDADIFTLLPCKSQRVLVTAALGTAILDSVQGVSIMLIQKKTVLSLTLYIRIHCIAKPARYGNAQAIPYMACNVATARRPE